jgi:hypothetical protein
MRELERRIRIATWMLIVGLVLSGLTAIPIQLQLDVARAALGPDMSWNGRLPSDVSEWLRTLDQGVQQTAQRAPFMFYGTDWLAFGHLMIAVVFVGALSDPVRNRWLFKFGVISSLAVLPWAAVFGPIRGIPVWWRFIDASFGVGAVIPAWLCYRWTGQIEQQGAHDAG